MELVEYNMISSLIVKIEFKDKYTYKVLDIEKLDNLLKVICPFDSHVLAAKEDIVDYLGRFYHINTSECTNLDSILKKVNRALEEYQALRYGVYFDRHGES